MNVYNTVLYTSLERPLNTVIICHPNIKNELYRGPFEQIPKTLFNKEVDARLYERTVKSLRIWIHA